mmetsp:Transcript_9631/g.24885  ORF Transcript_9631/g.24885 Transcript_9631/m.24885 type:complete len:133 (-) Transcript_9631:201-599(-)
MTTHTMATRFCTQLGSSWQRLARQLAPGAILTRLLTPRALPSCIEIAAAPPIAPPSRPAPLRDWLDSLVLMAVPKKRLSYTRKRVRQAGQQRMRGPYLQSHQSMCPVCERMRSPHRVCGREDCRTYWKHRWF